jgi:chromate transporter
LKTITLTKLFLRQLYINLISFGGGPTAIVQYENFLVNEEKLYSKRDFDQIIVQANVIPGPMFVILAVIFGRKIANIKGIIVMLIPAFMMSVVAVGIFYLAGQNTTFLNLLSLVTIPFVIASNIDYIIKGFKSNPTLVFLIIFLLSLALLYFGMNIIILIVSLIFVSLSKYLLEKK